MELTKEDKEYLASIKVDPHDYRQIADAADCTKYELVDADEAETVRILTRDEAIKKLGREAWLDGLVRSAFHWTAMRKAKRGKRFVYFDSKELFK